MPDGDYRFRLLNDLPLAPTGEDYFAFGRIADDLAQVLHASRDRTPFVLAIDGRWGSGKSSLMRALSRRLEGPANRVVWFNAWSAGDAKALPALLLDVLRSLDRNAVRRAYRKATSNPLVTGIARLTALVGARFLGLDRLLGALFQQMAVDASARGEARKLVQRAVDDWLARTAIGGSRGMITIFVDDLDRCTPRTVADVCEAIKLYLEVPGIVFVLGSDLVELTRIADAAGGTGDPEHARRYLEKIIQVIYQVPVPEQSRARALLDGYAAESGTARLFSPLVRDLVTDRTLRNPRQVKRLINSFVLEYRLNAGRDEFGAEALMCAVLLQHLHPDFYRFMIERDDDVIGPFLAYRDAREQIRRGEANRPFVEGVLDRVGMPRPEDWSAAALLALLPQIDAEMPAGWPALARIDGFVSLLHSVGDADERLRFQRLLRNQPLSTAPVPPAESAVHVEVGLSGVRLLWLGPETGTGALPRSLMSRGAEVTLADGVKQAAGRLTGATHVVLNLPFDTVDELRELIERLRLAGFWGPVCVFTWAPLRRSLVTDSHLQVGLAATEAELVTWLVTEHPDELAGSLM